MLRRSLFTASLDRVTVSGSTRVLPGAAYGFTYATPRYTVPYVGPATTLNASRATAPATVVARRLSVMTTTP